MKKNQNDCINIKKFTFLRSLHLKVSFVRQTSTLSFACFALFCFIYFLSSLNTVNLSVLFFFFTLMLKIFVFEGHIVNQKSFSFIFWKNVIKVNLFVLKTRRILMFFMSDGFALKYPFVLSVRPFIDWDRSQLVLILIFVWVNFSFFDLIRVFVKVLL